MEVVFRLAQTSATQEIKIVLLRQAIGIVKILVVAGYGAKALAVLLATVVVEEIVCAHHRLVLRLAGSVVVCQTDVVAL